MYIALVVCLCVFQVPVPGFNLWSTDEALVVPHLRPMQWDAATREGRHCPRVWPHPAASCHVAFYFFKLTRANSHRRGSNLGRFTLNRADSSLNWPYRPESSVSAETAETANSGWNSKEKKKKKKKVQNAPFELNLKSSFSSLHTNTPNFLY